MSFLVSPIIMYRDLLERWKCDLSFLLSFAYSDDSFEPAQLTAYKVLHKRSCGERVIRGAICEFAKVSRTMFKVDFKNSDVTYVEDEICFSSEEVKKIEEENPLLLCAQEDNGPKEVDGKFVFSIHQLIKKGDLYRRWFGATEEEIAMRFDNGELRAYEHYKGLINTMIWCKPGYIYYYDKQDYSNPGLYQFIDEQCDYFLLEDVESCEYKCPEYNGNISPEGFELKSIGQQDTSISGADAIPIRQIRNELCMSPQRFVDFLNDDSASNRIITSYEEGFRDYAKQQGFRGSSAVPYFTVTMLDNDGLTVHRLDWETFQKREKENVSIEEISFPSAAVDTFALESQLDEAQGQLGFIRQGNKLLNEQNQELKSELAEARQRMEEMERQFATMPTPNNGQGKDEGAWEHSVTAACKAVAHVLEEKRRDWVSGQEKGTGDTDSAGKETFRALLNRMHPQGDRCRVKAETAAWRVISDMDYTHTGGRKPNP